MEFINAETITPNPQEEQIWGKVEDKLEQSYASTPGQACTARRAIDATKDFNIKTGKDYAFLAGFKVFSTKDSIYVTA